MKNKTQIFAVITALTVIAAGAVIVRSFKSDTEKIRSYPSGSESISPEISEESRPVIESDLESGPDGEDMPQNVPNELFHYASDVEITQDKMLSRDLSVDTSSLKGLHHIYAIAVPIEDRELATVKTKTKLLSIEEAPELDERSDT